MAACGAPGLSRFLHDDSQNAKTEEKKSQRAARRKGNSNALVSLSGADPLNLAGILTPGPKLASLTRNRVLYRDGIPIALLEGGEIRFLETLEAGSEWAARKACYDPRFRRHSRIYRDTMCGRLTRPTRVHWARWHEVRPPSLSPSPKTGRRRILFSPRA